jgi:hypothetical protein
MGGVSEAPIIRKWEVCTDICSRLGGLASSVDQIQWSNVRVLKCPAALLVARTRRNFFGWHALLTDTHVDFLRKREPLQNLPGASSDKICWVYGLYGCIAAEALVRFRLQARGNGFLQALKKSLLFLQDRSWKGANIPG